ncbi:hypothetical protein GGF46_002672 [Coemansia sp. RSA 552]|nr:hypothetical protein GGF46_002672 [Coemansia sp. RSA 552]
MNKDFGVGPLPTGLYLSDASSASNSDSEGIDSDVEERILSHLYYQTSDTVAAAAAPEDTNGSVDLGTGPSVPLGSPARETAGVEDKDDDGESKYSIRSRARLPGSRNGEQGQEGPLVSVVPAFRSATNSDDDIDEDGEGDEDAVATKSTPKADMSFNANDDNTVNGFLDSVASSGAATPSRPMAQQTMQVDAILSPKTPTAGANGPMAQTTAASQPGDSEYDYLDEAEIQGHNRYFMEEKEVICRRCHKPGHIAKDCTTVTCSVCGKEGHSSKECQLTGSVCHGCNMRGHMLSDCPRRTSKHHQRACERCNSQRHHTEECMGIWRRYVYKGPRPQKYADVEPWCYNCAARGHFGDECNQPRARGMGSFFDNTAFNTKNSPGKVIGRIPSPAPSTYNRHGSNGGAGGGRGSPRSDFSFRNGGGSSRRSPPYKRTPPPQSSGKRNKHRHAPRSFSRSGGPGDATPSRSHGRPRKKHRPRPAVSN